MIKFEFIGEVGLPKEPLRTDVYPVGTSRKLGFFIKKSKTCSAYVEMSDFKGEKQYDIKLKFKEHKDADKKEITIPFAKRNDKTSLEIAPDYYKKVLDLGDNFELKEEIRNLEYKIRNAKWNNEVNDETKKLIKELAEKSKTKNEFLTDGDLIEALTTKKDKVMLVESLKDTKVRVEGALKFEVNKKNGKVYRKFIPSKIELAHPEQANKLELKLDFVFGEDAIDEGRFEDEKIVDIMGYVEDYDKISKSQKLFPLPLVIDGGKLDLNNPKHVAFLELFKTQLTSDDGYKKLPLVISYYRGGKEVEFSEDMLTEAQKAMIEAGLSTLDTYRPKSGVIGDNIELFKIVNLDLKGDYTNGAVKQFDEDMLPEKMFIFNESVVINAKTDKVTETKQVKVESTVEAEINSLFD